MTNISGSVLRAVADWYDTQDGTDVLVSRIRDDAKKVDVDEERVNRLAEVFREAGAIDGALGFDVGRGIRAVLAVVDNIVDAEVVDARPRQWASLREVPDDVDVVLNRNNEPIRRDSYVNSWWHWVPGDARTSTPFRADAISQCDPFTEVVDGAQ